MSLTFGFPTYDRNGDCVSVAASDADGAFEIRITLAALKDHFGMKDASKADALGAYKRNRRKIEAEVVRRYELEEFETAGSFHMDSHHFQHLD